MPSRWPFFWPFASTWDAAKRSTTTPEMGVIRSTSTTKGMGLCTQAFRGSGTWKNRLAVFGWCRRWCVHLAPTPSGDDLTLHDIAHILTLTRTQKFPLILSRPGPRRHQLYSRAQHHPFRPARVLRGKASGMGKGESRRQLPHRISARWRGTRHLRGQSATNMLSSKDLVLPHACENPRNPHVCIWEPTWRIQ